MSINKPRVKPRLGIPFIFDIDKEGTKVPSKFGAGYEYLYEGTLHEDGEPPQAVLIYLEPDAHVALKNIHATVGHMVSLVKLRDGGYTAGLIGSDATEPAAPPAGPRLLAPRPAYQNGTTTQTSAPPARPNAIEQQAALAQHIAQAARAPQQPQPRPAPPPPPPPTPGPSLPPAAKSEYVCTALADTWELYLKAAIEACHRGEMYAHELGMDLEFTSEDVRAIAITSFIRDDQNTERVKAA
jgi:hypothetical protein